jgi:hypothetical protein
MVAAVLARHKALEQAPANVVVSDHQQHHRELGVHPAVARAASDAIAQPQPQTQRQGGHRQQGAETHELVRHGQQPLAFGHALGRHHGQVDKNAR